MQHLRGRIAKSDVRTTYVPRTYIRIQHCVSALRYGAETKIDAEIWNAFLNAFVACLNPEIGWFLLPKMERLFPKSAGFVRI